jgi:hypothetical protein
MPTRGAGSAAELASRTRVVGVVTLDDLLVRSTHTLSDLARVVEVENGGPRLHQHLDLRAS